MNCQLLISNFQKHVHLSSEEAEMIAASLRPTRLKKKQLLLHQGQIAKDAAFVVDGCLKSYSVDDNGFEHILQFAPSEWWITDMYSFISQKESILNIEVIVDAEVLLLSRIDQLKLFDKIPKLERYFRILTENSLVSTRQRLIDNLSLTAKQRYEQFCSTYPSLIHILPQKQIASFIGVTPEFLSKLRASYQATASRS